MPRTIQITLMGGFEILIDGRRIREQDWDRRRPLELVQLLALARGAQLVRDQVIDALWPDMGLQAGGANLRKTAHRARQLLGCDDAVVLRSGKVHLFPDDDVTTDVEAFSDGARAALAAGDPDRCASMAATVPGPLLPGSPYDPWTTDVRGHVHRLHLDLLRTAGRWEEVIHLQPTDEGAYQALLRAALERGQRAAAIRWFTQARSALRTELGVVPSPETTDLYRRAVDGLADEPVTLIGREVELARAGAALSPRTDVLAVRGAPGIGKSALCRELVAGAASRGWAHCWTDAAGAPRPYGPLTDLAERHVADDAAVWAGLSDHAKGVLSGLSDAVPTAAPPSPLTRHQVLGAITSVLRIHARGAPVLLVVDDAHQADRATLDVVLQLAGSVRDVTVVLAMRPDPVPTEFREELSRLDRGGRLVTVDLGPLTDGAATTLVRRAADRDLDRESVARLVRLGQGIPFALGELARSHDGDTCEELPRSVAEAITTRLVSLGDDDVALLRRLSVAGEDLDSATVVALTGTSEEETLRLLDRCLEAGVLVVSGDRYRFRHDLLRQALLARVAPHRRQAVHRDAALRLAGASAPATVIAAQWLRAREPGEAAPWCLAAAKEAAQVGAFSDARRHLVAVLDNDPACYEAARLDAECLDMLGDPAALAAYDVAIALAPIEEADDLVANRALAQVKQGDPAGALVTIHGARPRSRMGRINEALTYAGAAALGATDPALGTAKAAEVRRLALKAGDRAGLTIASWAHAAAAHARGDLHDMVLNDLRETTDLPDLAVRVFDGHLCMTQRFLYGSRPYDEVITFAGDLAREAERLGAARGRAFGTTLRGEALLLSGHVEEALTELSAALDLHRATSGTTGEAHAVIRLAEAHHHIGLVHDARRLLDTALDLARSSDIGFHLLDRMYGVRIALAADAAEGLARVEEAEVAVRGPLETCPGCRIHLTIPAAIAAARGGDLGRARRYVESATYLTDIVMRLPAWYAALDEARAHLERQGGSEDAAVELFTQAADRFDDAGQPLDAGRCRAAV